MKGRRPATNLACTVSGIVVSGWIWRGLRIGAMTLLLGVSSVGAKTLIDEESPWPRVRMTNGHVVTLHQPQVETWTSNSFVARSAVGLKMKGAKAEIFGVVWVAAQGQVDRAHRLVTLDHLEVIKARFPEAPDNSSNALAIVRELVPAGARTVSLDYLTTALGFAQAAARQGARGLKHEPPEIIWVTNRTVLVLIHGEPILQAVPDIMLQRVVNTPALLLFDTTAKKFYLNGDGHWFAANAISGEWSLAQTPPPAVAALAPVEHSEKSEAPPPRVIVRTKPAELLVTSGLPDFRSIRGTSLQYAADAESQLFFYKTSREAYLLLSGRWFKAKALSGPWTYVAPRELPADFAKIPPGSAQAVVLASVPDTRPAQLALLANTVPATATVKRQEAKIEVRYDGEPKFKSIDGTGLSYAINARLPVIVAGSHYYALDNGVWFAGAAAAGPWQVATEVPAEVYTIPPSSPVYYVTFASVLQSSDDEVEVGYTPGYQGAYEEDGTIVYGTGWDYESWYEDDYYDWGWTWGYSYWYVPWYQWWVWRNWWDQPGALRSAVIENIYDRWQGQGVRLHDGGAFGSGTLKPSATAASRGFPAQYGRYQGASKAAALMPPPNAIALNPYSRPTSAVRPGEVPRGAQLLTTLRQSPGGGRDLYASPDGGVYQRKTDGWYRREGGGQWKYAAALQGRLEPNAPIPGRGGGQAGAGPVYRPVAQVGGAGQRGRIPDRGFEAGTTEVAALEREYYARSLARFQAQNWGNAGSRARPARGGGRRR